MKTNNEVLNFGNEFTFYERYNTERVTESNHVRDCVTGILNKCDFIKECEIIEC